MSALGNGVKGRPQAVLRKFWVVHAKHSSEQARHPRCGLQRLESRVRENRTHGSEGGEAKAFPTPIAVRLRERPKVLHGRPNSSCEAYARPRGVDTRDKPGHDGRSLLMPHQPP